MDRRSGGKKGEKGVITLGMLLITAIWVMGYTKIFYAALIGLVVFLLGLAVMDLPAAVGTLANMGSQLGIMMLIAKVLDLKRFRSASEK